MKKFISILVAAVMAASCLSACGHVNCAALETEQSVSDANLSTSEESQSENDNNKTEKLKIVTTIFP